MREIKFRAWDTKEKEWVDPAHGMDFVDPDSESPSFWLDPPNYIVLMQHTGLKDKNGKEIYEGDIVKADWGQGVIAEIMFEDGAFVLGIRDDCYRDMAGEDNNLYYEVFGNIYENPELTNYR